MRISRIIINKLVGLYMFHARFISGKKFEYPVTKVVCVGRNYAEHARELDNPIPETPILFIKPESSVVSLEDSFTIPETDCHYETEIAILIGKELSNVNEKEAESGITGVGLALDLTRRALQSELKKNSHPWEVAKSFDGACPLSQFISYSDIDSLKDLHFSLAINGEVRQQGLSNDMITPVIALIVYISKYFRLRAGDVVLTGTPKGVGSLVINDKLELNLLNKLFVRTEAVSCEP